MRIRMIVIIIMFCTAQSSFATITGTVTDTSGNPIPRALVMFTSEPDSNTVYMAVTDSTGQYELGDFPTGIAEEAPFPFTLGENYPNPFNPATSIPFTLDAPGHVSLTIYNTMGQRVRTLVDDYMTEGVYLRCKR